MPLETTMLVNNLPQAGANNPAIQRRCEPAFTRRLFVTLTSALFALTGIANAQERLPTIPPAQYTQAQQQAAADFLAARKYPVQGPFEPMMYSPDVLTRARAMGDYLRYKSRIGNTLSEFTILITARDWGQDYEWSVHAPRAAKAGIKPEVIAAIRDGRRPDGMNSDETIIYDFATELLHNKRVSDPTFAVAAARFGKPAVVDLVSIVGYYTFNAMVLNTARYPVKDGTTLPHFPD
jgi:4-carboxymuconolactone decarboxylase